MEPDRQLHIQALILNIDIVLFSLSATTNIVEPNWILIWSCEADEL